MQFQRRLGHADIVKVKAYARRPLATTRTTGRLSASKAQWAHQWRGEMIGAPSIERLRK